MERKSDLPQDLQLGESVNKPLVWASRSWVFCYLRPTVSWYRDLCFIVLFPIKSWTHSYLTISGSSPLMHMGQAWSTPLTPFIPNKWVSPWTTGLVQEAILHWKKAQKERFIYLFIYLPWEVLYLYLPPPSTILSGPLPLLYAMQTVINSGMGKWVWAGKAHWSFYMTGKICFLIWVVNTSIFIL